MDYFSAVQEGRSRVKRAVDFLQEVAGPSYPVLFLKPGQVNWTPVGDELLYSVVAGKDGTAAVVVCDGEGNSKAMSKWFPAGDAKEIGSKLALLGSVRFAGEVILPI